MAIDEAILESYVDGESAPTLRLYGWRPPCVSIGYFQSLLSEVRVERCREIGVDWVRRPTGGRLILHDMELTYSVVASERDPLVSGGILESYRKISEALRTGLGLLGVEAHLADPTNPAVAAASKMKGGLCFDAAAGHELTVGGRKIAGSAQVRRRGRILQHGTLLLDVDIDRLFQVVRLPSERTLLEFAAGFHHEVVTLREAMARTPSVDEVASAIKQGFVRAWGVDLIKGALTEGERAMASTLRRKYASDEWNLAR